MPVHVKIIGGAAYSTTPNLNTGPFSQSEIEDIEYGVEHSQSVAEMATFLCRSEAEVAEKIVAMGLQIPRP